MDMNRSFVLAFIGLCLSGCTNYMIREVEAKFIAIKDSKPCSDSLYSEWSENVNTSNPRFIELQYHIHNHTENKMYLPIKTWSDSTVKSFIDVYFLNKADTVRPVYSTKKIPYDTNYICKGDSMILFVKIIQFEKWSKNGIDVGTDIDSLINKIHMEYHISQEDLIKGYEIPIIKFDKSPQFCYEIPRGSSIDPL